MNTNRNTNDNTPVEIIDIDELEKEEPEDSTVNTQDYGDDISDTTPQEAEELINEEEKGKRHPEF